MTPVRMTTLKQLKNGDWFARKMVPEEVRAAYKDAYGVASEARFRFGQGPVKGRQAGFREWDAEIASRIERLKADAQAEV